MKAPSFATSWTEALETGLAEVDAQHRRLFEMTDALFVLVPRLHRGGRAEEELHAVFAQLRDYTHYHFQAEAELMRAWPVDEGNRKAHLRAHAQFDAYLARAQKMLVEDTEVVAERVLAFLVKWLVQHIGGVDQQMAREIQSLQSGTAGERGAGEPTARYGVLVDTISELYDDLSDRNLKALALTRRLKEQLRRQQMLDKALRTLSGCNRALVRSGDASGLMEEMCRVVVEQGGFVLAWVGMVQDDAEGAVHPVAWSGEGAGYITGLRVAAAEQSAHGHGPGGTALRSGEPQVVNDMREGSAESAPWREQALAHGLRSLIAVPLRDGGESGFGLLVIYAAEAAAFDAETVALFGQLGDDLAYGLRALRTREALGVSEQRLHRVVEQSVEAVAVVDAGGRMVFANRAAEEVFGSGREALLGAVLPLELEGEAQALVEVARPDGERRHVERRVEGIEWGGQAMRMVSLHDVTKRVDYERQVARLSRMREVLGRINATIVRVTDRTELFEETCRIVVETGNFLFARVRLLNEERSALVPVVGRGLDALPFRAFDLREMGTTLLINRAASTRRVEVCNDVEADPDRSPIRLELIALGCTAFATLPLLAGEELLGLITIGSRETGVFDAEEVRLLEELGQDVGFALDHLDKQARIDYLALYDGLSGLANRSLFQDRIQGMVRGGRAFLVTAVNIVGFRRVNETFGMHGGDRLLQGFARRLAEHAGAEHVGRMGSDVFALLRAMDDLESAVRWVESLHAVLAQPFGIDGTELRIDTRFGVAVYPNDGAGADALVANAESALKSARKDAETIAFYRPELNVRVAERLMLENRLRRAVEDEQFVLHYQPKVDLSDGRILGAEALLRWDDPGRGLVSPTEFIPLLEETGLILEVGHWVLEEASAASARWRAAGLGCVEVAVNVSQVQMRRARFAEEVIGAIAAGGGAGGISVEITETLVMDDIEDAIAKLQRLRAEGIGVAIDDFGTGYSSLSYLARLPVDVVKIDRSFVTQMPRDEASRTLVSTIITLAETFGLRVVAEGVDSEEQLALLRELGCEQAQGFLFHKPLPEEQFERLLRDRAAE